MSQNTDKPSYHFEYTGRIVEIQPTQTFGSNGFKKRTIIIDEKGENAEYPNPVPFQLTKDRCDEADRFHVGGMVIVKGWFNGRKWHNEKKGIDQFFCDMMIGKIVAIDGNGNAVATETKTEVKPLVTAEQKQAEAEPVVDDLPF